MLFREPVDLAFVTIGDEIVGVRQHPLLELEYVPLTGRNEQLAQHTKLRLEDLNGLQCIAWSRAGPCATSSPAR